MIKKLLFLLTCLFAFSGCNAVISVSANNFDAEAYGLSALRVNLNEISGDLHINQGGTYFLTGTLNGTVFINTGKKEKVHLILDNAEIHSPQFAAVYAAECKKVLISLEENSVNRLVDDAAHEQVADNNVNACTYSKTDLELDGSGTPLIDTHESGIVSRDSLQIAGGSYTVNARKKGIVGKDELVILGGNILVNSEKDAISATEQKKADRGTVDIQGGTLEIITHSDGISAVNDVTISGGDISIQTLRNPNGKSEKGIKSGTQIAISGGSLTLKCRDDCIHSDGNVTLSGGCMTLSSDDDAVCAKKALTISGGECTVLMADEAFQGTSVEISGGRLNLNARDDGINASDASGNANESITIHGGELYICAGGDGLDSNGKIAMDGGSVIIDGPTSATDAAFDYATEGCISGGTLFAIGSSNEAIPLSDSSTQASFLLDLKTAYQAGAEISIIKDGQTLFAHTSAKAFSCVLFSCEKLLKGDRIEVQVNGDSYTVTAL